MLLKLPHDFHPGHARCVQALPRARLHEICRGLAVDGQGPQRGDTIGRDAQDLAPLRLDLTNDDLQKFRQRLAD
eukprot:6977427-Prymnesium_polylepis.1